MTSSPTLDIDVGVVMGVSELEGWQRRFPAPDFDLSSHDIASMLLVSRQEIDLEKVRAMAGDELGPLLNGVLEASEDD